MLVDAITALAATYLGTVLLYALYLAYCAALPLKEDGRLPKLPLLVRGHVYAIVYFALVLDIVFNILIGSIIFVELPESRRLTFTARCKKWKRYGSEAPELLTFDSRLNRWRVAVATWVCENLNATDPGHC